MCELVEKRGRFLFFNKHPNLRGAKRLRLLYPLLYRFLLISMTPIRGAQSLNLTQTLCGYKKRGKLKKKDILNK